MNSILEPILMHITIYEICILHTIHLNGFFSSVASDEWICFFD